MALSERTATLRLILDTISEASRISGLADLHALTDTLHGTRERGSILQTIQSIAKALCDSDEVAIFEVDARRARLVPVATSGIDADDFPAIPLGTGLIGRAVDAGEIFERLEEPEASLTCERHLRVCIPLRMDSTPVGAIAVFASHGHYLVQEPVNREWAAIFARHAASALYWTGVYETAIAALHRDW